MEQKLLNHSQKHFSQAKGTPYTTAPLNNLLGYDGLTEFGNQVFRGTIPPETQLPPAAKLLLQHQQSLLEPDETTEIPLTFNELMEGFKKWPEQTATSPSGRHLGTYKSMLKDLPEKDDHKQNPPKYCRIHVMHSIFALLQLVVKHTHMFHCWKTIWNMYLEKDIGYPKLTRLRTIHLMEANYNLLLKWYTAKGFFKHSEKHCRIVDEQGGSRQGCSAINMVCKKVVIYDILRTTKDEAIDVGNNANVCFDRMIKNCQNLSCRQQGANIQYLRLHAQTHQQLQYYHPTRSANLPTNLHATCHCCTTHSTKNILNPPAHSVYTPMGQQLMVPDMPPCKSISITQNTWTGTHGVPHQQHIC